MHKTIVFIYLFLIFISCKKERNSLTWDTDNYFPIAHGNLDVSSIVADSLTSIQSDSSVHIVLNKNLYTLSLDSIVSIPDTSLKDTFAVPFPVPVSISPGQVFINQPSNNKLQVEDVELKNVFIKDAVISYTLESTIQGDVIYVYSIPGSVGLDGLPFSKEVFVPAINGGHSIVSGTFQISNYSINLEGNNGNDVNVLQTNINVKVASTNTTTISVSSNDTLYVENSIQSIKVGAATGYFGQYNLDFGPSTSNFSAFNHIVSGNFSIPAITADFIVTNGAGVDLSFELNSLSASNSNQSIDFVNTIINQQQHINRAYKTGSSIVPGVYQTVFDQSNSNIIQLINLLPNKMSYMGNMEINPLGNVSGGNDFIDENSPVKVDLNLDLPLQVSINQLTLQDTIQMSDSVLDPIHSLSFHLDIENYFPIEAKVFIGLLDENNMITEQILSNNTIAKANYQNDLTHTFAETSFHTIELNDYQISLLKNNPKIIVKLIFDSDNSNVVLYDFYKMNYKIDAYINHEITLGN